MWWTSFWAKEWSSFSKWLWQCLLLAKNHSFHLIWKQCLRYDDTVSLLLPCIFKLSHQPFHCHWYLFKNSMAIWTYIPFLAYQTCIRCLFMTFWGQSLKCIREWKHIEQCKCLDVSTISKCCVIIIRGILSVFFISSSIFDVHIWFFLFSCSTSKKIFPK